MWCVLYGKKNLIIFFIFCQMILPSDFEFICDKGMTIWTLLDLMQAVTMTSEDKLFFAHKILLEVLDFYAVTADQRAINAMNDEQFDEVIALIDHVRLAFGSIFKNMHHDYLTCLWVILGIVEHKLYSMHELKAPGNIDTQSPANS